MARILSAGLSDPGLKRQNNEDRFHTDPDRGVFFVIDGVGGQNAGEKAADTAYKLIRGRLERQAGDVEDRIREAISLANNEIFALSRENSEWEGMACVLTVAVLQDGEVIAGHVGDSRLYLVEGGEIRKITSDHSPVGEREDRGEIDELTAMRHPRRNEVYRDVGSEEHTPDDPGFIEIRRAPFGPASALLLCSDGLSDLVPSDILLSTLERHPANPQAAAKALVDAANAAGGKDNITVVVVEGSRFASAIPRNGSTPERSASPARHSGGMGRIVRDLILLLAGILLTAGAVYLAKPRWTSSSAGLTFGWGTVPQGRTIRVSGDLEAALNQAGAGDTVLVPAGVYNTSLWFKEGVRLIAEQPREAVIAASGTALIAEDLKSGSVEGFRFVSGEDAPLETAIQIRNSAIQVVDCEITGATVTGIDILSTSNPILRANHLYANSGTGIVVRDSSSPRLLHNSINGNGKAGVDIQNSAQPFLSGNILSDNKEDLLTPPRFARDALIRQNFFERTATPPVRATNPASGRRSRPR